MPYPKGKKQNIYLCRECGQYFWDAHGKRQAGRLDVRRLYIAVPIICAGCRQK